MKKAKKKSAKSSTRSTRTVSKKVTANASNGSAKSRRTATTKDTSKGSSTAAVKRKRSAKRSIVGTAPLVDTNPSLKASKKATSTASAEHLSGGPLFMEGMSNRYPVVQGEQHCLTAGQLYLARKLRDIALEFREMETVALESRGHKFTRAQDVFRKYHQRMLERDIMIRCVDVEQALIPSRYQATFRYEITCLETGAILTGASLGGGAINLGFGAATASTIALKQFVLCLFMAVWDNGLEMALQRVEDVIKDKGPKLSPQDALDAFFGSEAAVSRNGK